MRSFGPRTCLFVIAIALSAAAGGAEARKARPPGVDFADDARLMLRVAACAGDEAVPDDWAKVVADHCTDLNERIAGFRKSYIEQATPFLAPLRPATLPTSVVYPFGGGDLVSALLSFPDATEITTISLEHAGDPTRLRGLSAKDLKKHLGRFREAVRGLLANHDSATSNMQKLERGPIPGQLSFFLVAAAVMGYQPVSMRFFRVEDDGTLYYYEQTEIDELGATKAKKKKSSIGTDTDYSVAYTNVETTFEHDTTGHRVVHRHMAANLENSVFDGSGLEKHLEAKGTVAAMTKAASYLLWLDSFSAVRDYLIGSASFMFSDSTGIPSKIAKKAGLEQTTYGRFAGPFLEASEGISSGFRKLWKAQPYRKLPFRYGYPDSAGSYHMMITQRPLEVAPATEQADQAVKP
jgi:hypothetical protein